MPDVGILITARTASTRLPRKAFVEIAGRSLIGLVIERLEACRPSLPIVLCTTTEPDDDELAAVATRAQIGVYRGANEDVARRLLGAVRQFGLQHFVRVTGDSPLCCHPLVGVAVDSHLRHAADYTCMPGVFIGGAPEVVSAGAIAAIAQRAVEGANTEYLSWYLDNPASFRVNRVDVDPAYARRHRLTLDTVEDLHVVRVIYDALYSPGVPVDALRALDWLDAHPDVARINEGILPKFTRDDLNVSLHP